MSLPEIAATTQVGFPILSVIILLPAIAALIARFVPSDSLALKVVLGASGLELALAVYAWIAHDPTTAAMQLSESGGIFGLAKLGIDGVSVMFIPVTALLTLFAVFYTLKSVTTNVRGYLAILLLSEAALMGAFAALDLSVFWVFFVIEIVATYALIKGWGIGEERNSAAQSYLISMGLSAIVVAVGFILIAANVTSGFTFDLATIAAETIDPELQPFIFFVLCFGFAIKAPLFPLHSWLPKVLEHGPLVGMSVLVVGVKLGAYSLIRFVIPLLPEATAEWFWLMATFGLISMVYGAMIAMVQTNLRRLVAFASVSHMGVVTVGLFSLNVTGIEGGLLQALNLGITAVGLFLIASFITSRIGAPELSAMGGLQSRAPYMAFGFLVIALAAVGMPGTSGFNGEHLILLGAYEKHWLMALCVGIGPILAAAYFLRYYQRAFLGEASPETENKVLDLDGREKVIVLSIVGVVFWIGLYTTPFLSTMHNSVEGIASQFQTSGSNHALDAEDSILQGGKAQLALELGSPSETVNQRLESVK